MTGQDRTGQNWHSNLTFQVTFDWQLSQFLPFFVFLLLLNQLIQHHVCKIHHWLHLRLVIPAGSVYGLPKKVKPQKFSAFVAKFFCGPSLLYSFWTASNSVIIHGCLHKTLATKTRKWIYCSLLIQLQYLTIEFPFFSLYFLKVSTWKEHFSYFIL